MHSGGRTVKADGDHNDEELLEIATRQAKRLRRSMTLNYVLGALVIAIATAAALVLTRDDERQPSTFPRTWAASQDVERANDMEVLVFAPDGRYEGSAYGDGTRSVCSGTWERSDEVIEATCELTIIGSTEIEVGLRVMTYHLVTGRELVSDSEITYRPG